MKAEGYREVREGAALFERDDRVLLRAQGRDPVGMIQGLVTNDLKNAPEDRAIYAAVLTPKGRMIADIRALKQPDGSVLLDVDQDALEGLTAHLRKMVPPLFAKFDEPEPALRVLGVYGLGSAQIVADVLHVDVSPGEPEDRVLRADWDGTPVLVLTTREAGVDGFDLIVPADAADDLVVALEGTGAAPGSAEALELLRVEAGRPRWGAELSEERIPLEADLLERAISTSKGCYTGQEVIIRILHRGHVNWSLRGLLFDEDASDRAIGSGPAVEPGAELTAEPEGKVVARVTSAVVSPGIGRTIALGYVRREIEPGAELQTAEGARAHVVALPFELPATAGAGAADAGAAEDAT